MNQFNILTRRDFFGQSFKLGLGVALSTLVDIPLVMKRALAAGVGSTGKKVMFVFLRGGNDGLNSIVPVGDPAYLAVRPDIGIPKDSATDYTALGPCDFPTSGATTATFANTNAIRLGNGFAGLHPSHKFLAPVYNAGDLALIHRVGYPKQSRSHFDSSNYWENGLPNNDVVKDGIFYRAMLESGLAGKNALTGVSVQSSLPLSLRGGQAAMTNLTDPTRYNLLGIPNTTDGNTKADNFLRASMSAQFADKKNRELLELQYQNMSQTLAVFAAMDFSETGNIWVDDTNTDGDVPYYLFPTTNAKNGGSALNGRTNDATKYVVDTGAYSFFNNLKSAAMILNKTDAIIAGTEVGGFDTHQNQGGVTGGHANLQRRIAWSMYALKKYFTKYADKCNWNNLVVVTLSEFGRTTVQNSDRGTDHAEASVMFAAGGAVKGYNKRHASGVFGCSPSDSIPWVPGTATAQTGTMFGVSSRYLKRAIDYRSVLGEVIRDHLGATTDQLGRIIPGYANAGEKLQSGGTNTIDGTPIMGELDLV